MEITPLDPQGNPITMRLVSAGTFTMGSNADDALAECQKYRDDCDREWFLDEEPAHEVTLDDYSMDIYEVTNTLYKVCVDAGGCTKPGDTSDYNNTNYASHPIVYVDWNQAKAYCEWRGARLPTEAEWEKAARGADEHTYPWGEGIDCSRANYYVSTQGKTCVDDTTAAGSYTSSKSPYEHVRYGRQCLGVGGRLV